MFAPGVCHKLSFSFPLFIKFWERLALRNSGSSRSTQCGVQRGTMVLRCKYGVVCQNQRSRVIPWAVDMVSRSTMLRSSKHRLVIRWPWNNNEGASKNGRFRAVDVFVRGRLNCFTCLFAQVGSFPLLSIQHSSTYTYCPCWQVKQEAISRSDY